MVFDYMMPNMNGAEFLMEVRKFDQDVVAIFFLEPPILNRPRMR